MRSRSLVEDINRAWLWRWCDQTFPGHDRIETIADLRLYVSVARYAAPVLDSDWIVDHARHWHLSILLTDDLFTSLNSVTLDDDKAWDEEGVIRQFEHQTFTASRWATPGHITGYRSDEFAQRITATCWSAMLNLSSTIANPTRPNGRIDQIDRILDVVDGWVRTVDAPRSLTVNGGTSGATVAKDFCWLRTSGGVEYTFTATQRRIVADLWHDYQERGLGLSQDHLLTEANPDGGKSLKDLFKSHPAWGTLIVKGSARDVFRLNPEGM